MVVATEHEDAAAERGRVVQEQLGQSLEVQELTINLLPDVDHQVGLQLLLSQFLATQLVEDIILFPLFDFRF